MLYWISITTEPSSGRGNAFVAQTGTGWRRGGKPSQRDQPATRGDGGGDADTNPNVGQRQRRQQHADADYCEYLRPVESDEYTRPQRPHQPSRTHVDQYVDVGPSATPTYATPTATLTPTAYQHADTDRDANHHLQHPTDQQRGHHPR